VPPRFTPTHFDADLAAAVPSLDLNATGLPGFLGIRTVEVTPGRMVAEIDLRDDLKNPFGSIHGGVISALVDHVLGAVIYPHIERGRWAATTGFTINLLAAAREGTLRAEATIISLTKRQAVVQVEVADATRLVALAQGTVTIPDAPAAAKA
jgi:uncharacterized protein (TIGR00369 family)